MCLRASGMEAGGGGDTGEAMGHVYMCVPVGMEVRGGKWKWGTGGACVHTCALV